MLSFAFGIRITESRDECRPRSAFRSQIGARLPGPCGPLLLTNRSVRSFC